MCCLSSTPSYFCLCFSDDPRTEVSEIAGAKGLSCPQPVIFAKNGFIKKAERGGVIMVVDTTTQVYNRSCAAEKPGWKAS